MYSLKNMSGNPNLKSLTLPEEVEDVNGVSSLRFTRISLVSTELSRGFPQFIRRILEHSTKGSFHASSDSSCYSKLFVASKALLISMKM
jgi:hypothetical protein